MLLSCLPPPPKRIKRPAKVIDEDSYTDALSHIIARDFFPGLVETESKQDYLDALDSQDHEWIAAAGRKLTEVMTPGPDGRRHRGRRGTSMTPTSGLYGRGGETPQTWQGDTPMSVISSSTSMETSEAGKPEVDTNLSLSAFQAKYTSEDNESFYKLLDKQNLKKSQKYAWMWSGNKIASPRQIAHRQREARLLATKAAQEATDGDNDAAAKPLTIEAADTRQAMPDAWPSRPDNPLMFEPGSVEDSTQTVHQRAESSSRAPQKQSYTTTPGSHNPASHPSRPRLHHPPPFPPSKTPSPATPALPLPPSSSSPPHPPPPE